jgi:putative phage-type endonuclease
MLTEAQKIDRLKGIGGSDAAVVVGLSPFKSPYQLYLEKRGEAPLDEEETFRMQLGNILEEPIAQLYCERTGRTVRRQPLAVHDEYSFMLANIDRQILKDPRGPGIYEGKTTNEWSGREIHGADDIPDHYYIQAQHYMAVYDYAWASFGILVGTARFVWCDILRNDEVIKELIEQEAEFWDRVQTGRPPAIDGSARTGDLIKKLYPKDTGKSITIDHPELIKAASEFTALKQQEKHIEAELKRLGNMLKSAIGDASTAVFPGFGEITWKASKETVKESLDLVKLQADFPDAYAACFSSETVPGSRRFLPKPLTK